jgi:glucose-1-phosphate cytidylyltransferase
MKVIILCGGLGSRLAEETKLIPKPMIKIGKMPILEHIIKIYKFYGFNQIILATGYKKEIINKYFKKYENVRCVYTGQKTLTGGRLLRLKKFFKRKENFMLTYGDGLANINLKSLLNFHLQHNKIATLTSVKPPARFGEVFLKGSKVKKFEEKSQLNKSWINGGFFVFNYKIFKFINGDNIMLEREPLTKLVQLKQLMAYKHYGFWQCMDTMRDKKILNELWNKKNAAWSKFK